ncbi:hypothetical protein VTN02DRAFT_5712 [Thermoascus thermophilus]
MVPEGGRSVPPASVPSSMAVSCTESVVPRDVPPVNCCAKAMSFLTDGRKEEKIFAGQLNAADGPSTSNRKRAQEPRKRTKIAIGLQTAHQIPGSTCRGS